MKVKKLVTLLIGLLFIVVMAASLAACTTSETDGGGDDNDLPENVEFIFTGSGTASTGRTLTFNMTGNQDSENSLLVTVEELPALSMSGNWVFVEAKGYKIYLNDPAGTLKYSQYDPASGVFSFNCDIDVGSYGIVNVDFTYEDSSFAASYDGEGLGKEPPTFTTVGWVGGVIEVIGTLTCTEEGTFATADTWHQSRSGTWEYDEDNDCYILTLADDPFYELYQGAVEAGTWGGTFTYKPWNTTEVAAENLTIEDMEEVNWFRDPIVCEWDEELGSYTGEIQLWWAVYDFGEITRFEISYEG